MLRKISFGIAMFGVMLGSGGCLFQANSSIEPTLIPQQLATHTPQPTETPTDGPTPEPEVIIITATPDLTAMAQITAVAQVLDSSEATDQAIIQEVTQTLAAATQVFLDMTASAEFDFQVPTATLTPDPLLTIPTATATTSFAVNTGDCEHIVSAGQNLFRIGLQYNVGYQVIANHNGIANPNLISIGQRIMIPNCGIGGGGSTESGSFGGGTTIDTSGGTTSGTIDPSLGSTCGSEVIVDQGDTLFAISLRCNVLIRQIMALNGIGNPDLIYFNQTLRLQ